MTSLPGAALLTAEMIALLLAVTFGITLLQRRLGDAAIRRWMGGPPRRAALKGIAVGFVTPFCTYSAIPVLIGMRQAGVRPAGYAAFIFAAPVVDPVMIGVLAMVIGPTGAAVYVVTAFAAAFLLALVVDAVDITPHLKPIPVPVAQPAPALPVPTSAPVGPRSPSPLPSCPSPNEVPWAGWAAESRTAVAPCCDAVEGHGLADRGRRGRGTCHRPAGSHRRPRRTSWIPTTPSPSPPRPSPAFRSTSAPSSSSRSAMHSTPRGQALEPSSRWSSQEREPTSPSSRCSRRSPGSGWLERSSPTYSSWRWPPACSLT